MPAPPEVKAQEGCVAEEGSFKRKVMLAMVRSGQRIYGTHVYGDRGLDQSMDIIEEGSRLAGLNLEQIRAKRHGVDHAGAVRPDQMERMVRLNMFQSYTGGVEEQSRFLLKNYGEKYVDWAYPIGSFIKAGGTSVWEGGGFARLQDFITRKGKDGRVWAPQERLDRTTALKIATIWPAEYMMRGDVLGSLEVGKKGDFVVLNRDYWEVPEEQISTVRPLMTVVDGKTRFLDRSWAGNLGLQPIGYQKE
jgi:predicted amidohydrolase YtcJ